MGGKWCSTIRWADLLALPGGVPSSFAVDIPSPAVSVNTGIRGTSLLAHHVHVICTRHRRDTMAEGGGMDIFFNRGKLWRRSWEWLRALGMGFGLAMVCEWAKLRGNEFGATDRGGLFTFASRVGRFGRLQRGRGVARVQWEVGVISASQGCHSFVGCCLFNV